MFSLKKSVPVHYSQVQGKTLSVVVNVDTGFLGYPTKCKVPGPNKLFNFDLTFDMTDGKRTLVVLDPYGKNDGPMDPELEKIVIPGMPEDYTLAICKHTGMIYVISFRKEGKKYIALFHTFEANGIDYRIPSSYLPQLDTLKTCKRPFCLSVWETALFDFVTKEHGYEKMRRHIILRFDIGVEVIGEEYREFHEFMSVSQ